ncbi:MAG: DUF1768 domain-containing protein [Crocinitomix sp.]|nr:DUF1768 domain-containing protein [Crocinitomix sp.]
MKYSLEILKEQFQKGERIKYLFFWGHQPSKDGSVSATCFSQWWKASFEVDGNVFRTAEHWMMYQKAILFADQEIAKEVLTVGAPMQAKALGRKVNNFDADIWDQHKFQIVIDGNLHKFKQHIELKEYLIKTGKRTIVEASPRDRIWGIGMGKDNEKAQNPLMWRGQNLLGFALMEVRDKLK